MINNSSNNLMGLLSQLCYQQKVISIRVIISNEKIIHLEAEGYPVKVFITFLEGLL